MGVLVMDGWWNFIRWKPGKWSGVVVAELGASLHGMHACIGFDMPAHTNMTVVVCPYESVHRTKPEPKPGIPAAIAGVARPPPPPPPAE